MEQRVQERKMEAKSLAENYLHQYSVPEHSGGVLRWLLRRLNKISIHKKKDEEPQKIPALQ